MARLSEVEYFFRVAARLRLAREAGCTEEQLGDWYDEIESLEFTTDNPKIRARCVWLLAERYRLAAQTYDGGRFTSEPFYDDLELA